MSDSHFLTSVLVIFEVTKAAVTTSLTSLCVMFIPVKDNVFHYFTKYIKIHFLESFMLN